MQLQFFIPQIKILIFNLCTEMSLLSIVHVREDKELKRLLIILLPALRIVSTHKRKLIIIIILMTSTCTAVNISVKFICF